MAALENEKSAALPGGFRLAVTGPAHRNPTIHVVNLPFVLIGRARAAGLRLDHPEVSRRHLYLQLLFGRVYCLDLSDGESPTADTPLSGRWLEPDEVVSVGPYEVRLVDVAETGAPSAPLPAGFSPLERYAAQLGPMPKVEIEFFTSVAYQTNSTMTRLIVLGGTSDRCKLRLQNKSISAIHFALVLMQDGLWVADLAGKTGAFVNNRTAHFARIGDGDELQVGTFRLRAGTRATTWAIHGRQSR